MKIIQKLLYFCQLFIIQQHNCSSINNKHVNYDEKLINSVSE